MTGTPGAVVTAVGNGELLVGAGGNLTALVSYPNSAVPKVAVKLTKPYATFRGPPARVTGSLAQPGIEQSYEFTVAGRPAGSKRFGRTHATHTKPDGTLALTERPKLNTLYRISLPGSSVALSLLELVALPQIRYKFGTPAGSHGQVRISVAVPAQVHLAHHRASLYIGRAKSKRYVLLGSGRLTGHAGHFAASFAFKLEQHVGKKDFVTACFAGLYRQRMSYGDHLDRRCGAAKIKF